MTEKVYNPFLYDTKVTGGCYPPEFKYLGSRDLSSWLAALCSAHSQ